MKRVATTGGPELEVLPRLPHEPPAPEAREVGQLVERARRKDAAAFGQIVRRYERVVLSVAFGVLGDASAAGDVTQETFVRAWQRLGDLKDPASFGPWLCGIARNLAVDARRKRQREPKAGSDAVANAAQAPAASAPFPRLVADGPLEEVGRREQREQIAAALDSLDDVSRQAVVLRYYEDLSSKQIGELLGLAPAAVDMRLMRARRQLRQRLGHAESDAPGPREA
jgi:RNA polymerase sigma factor (sigma-70 family)